MVSRSAGTEPVGGAGDDESAGSNPGAPESSTAPAPKSYEQARDELTQVVETLEEGGLSLDESLALWERGQALAQACETFLAGARARVEAALATPAGQEAPQDGPPGT